MTAGAAAAEGAIPTKVAVIGAGDIGCGWATLCVAAGWPLTVYDTGGHAADLAVETIARRARALVALERAPHGVVERGLLEVQRARSLLQAVRDADWVIEAVTEDIAAKQKLFEAVEQVSAPAALLSSSSSGLPPSEIFGRVLDRSRCLVIHPLNPPELMPLVELVPCPETAATQLDQAQAYLRALGRIPITLKKAVPGYVVGRVAAAVWRECIDLVLSGVIGVSDLDRAVSLGPALGWAAAGPHLTYHLGAGSGGVPMFLQHLLTSFEGWWADLARWEKLEPDQQRALVLAIEKAYAGQLDTLRHARDRRLGAILKGLEDSKTT